MRDSIVFYKSFLDAIRNLPEEEFKAVTLAILDYGINDEIPKLNGIAKVIFTLVKPQIDANNIRFVNGKKGGRPKTIGLETKNHSLSDEKPNVNVNDNDNENVIKIHRFTKPTVEEIEAYCRERKNKVDPEAFFDFYESKGWKVGKNTMKDWKACVRNWERSETKPTKKGKFNNFEQREEDIEAEAIQKMKERLGL